MGEKQNQPFQLSFNASLKVDFQGSRVTSDSGLIRYRRSAHAQAIRLNCVRRKVCTLDRAFGVAAAPPRSKPAGRSPVQVDGASSDSSTNHSGAWRAPVPP
jgi:hypothetical protein